MRILPALAASLFILLPTSASRGCDLHPVSAGDIHNASVRIEAVSPFWAGPAVSGSWYTASRSGEGFTLQVLEDGSALVMWFTYPPAGSSAKQAWILGLGGTIDGNRIRFENAFTTHGPRFGPSFDPAQVEIIPWGTIEFQFTGCNDATFSYSGPPGWGSGTRPLVRLTAVAELECAGKRQLVSTGARALAGLKSHSGSWFDPAHNGEGWQLEELPDGRVQIYWFTYDENGAQAWTIGTAAAGGDRIELDANLLPVGTHFGADFDSANVHVMPWGRLSLQFDGCNAGLATYDSTLPAFGSGLLRPVRLSSLAGTKCLATAPPSPLGGNWTLGSPMPNPQSEHATAIVDGTPCVLGGFGEKRGFKCYDLAANAWSRRADLPVSRDHAEAVGLGGEVLFAGGYASDLAGPQNISGFRYQLGLDRWEPVPELPGAAGASGGAVLAGFAYFADIGGNLHQFNPRTRAVRTIPSDNRTLRDHSQLVAFQGELWLMGGRDTKGVTNGRVSIFDPASETWRPGPSIVSPRSGFAAAASDTMIVVAGGERLDLPSRVLTDVEAIVAGDFHWNALPPLPFGMHGFGGVLQGNAFVTLGGSRIAAGTGNQGQVQIYRW